MDCCTVQIILTLDLLIPKIICFLFQIWTSLTMKNQKNHPKAVSDSSKEAFWCTQRNKKTALKKVWFLKNQEILVSNGDFWRLYLIFFTVHCTLYIVKSWWYLQCVWRIRTIFQIFCHKGGSYDFWGLKIYRQCLARSKIEKQKQFWISRSSVTIISLH